MNVRIPTCFYRREGYGVDSVQKRLGEIVYLDSKPKEMLSRKGKFLEQNRDKTQMLGVAQCIGIGEDNDQRLKKILEKTFNDNKFD